MHAARYGKLAMVKYLTIECKADANKSDRVRVYH